MGRPSHLPWTSKAVRQPQPPLRVEPETWSAGHAFSRVHNLNRAPTFFNPGLGRPTRFAPIWDAQDRPIPTLYGAEGMLGALSETIFRDLPNPPAERRIDVTRLRGSAVSTLAPTRDLVLARCHGTGLTALGTTRRRLIEPLAAHYPWTARWAEAIHDAASDATGAPRLFDGLIWRSRQNDDELVFLLFGGDEKHGFARARLNESELELVDPPLPLDSGSGLDHVVAVASKLYIHVSGL